METLINELNSQLSKDFKIHRDMIHSTEAKTKEGVTVRFLGYTNTILHDTKTVPEDILIKVSTIKPLKNILIWINKKIFTAALNYLRIGKNIPQFLELVRIRIISNVILKQNTLTKEEKTEWIMQIQNVFYERKRAMFNYYLDKIEQLPF